MGCSERSRSKGKRVRGSRSAANANIGKGCDTINSIDGGVPTVVALPSPPLTVMVTEAVLLVTVLPKASLMVMIG